MTQTTKSKGLTEPLSPKLIVDKYMTAGELYIYLSPEIPPCKTLLSTCLVNLPQKNNQEWAEYLRSLADSLESNSVTGHN